MLAAAKTSCESEFTGERKPAKPFGTLEIKAVISHPAAKLAIAVGIVVEITATSPEPARSPVGESIAATIDLIAVVLNARPVKPTWDVAATQRG